MGQNATWSSGVQLKSASFSYSPADVSHDGPRALLIYGPRSSKTLPKFHEKTPRERKRAKMGAGRGTKKRKFGGPVEDSPAEGGSCVQWSGAGWSRRVPNTARRVGSRRVGS